MVILMNYGRPKCGLTWESPGALVQILWILPPGTLQDSHVEVMMKNALSFLAEKEENEQNIPSALSTVNIKIPGEIMLLKSFIRERTVKWLQHPCPTASLHCTSQPSCLGKGRKKKIVNPETQAHQEIEILKFIEQFSSTHFAIIHFNTDQV